VASITACWKPAKKTQAIETSTLDFGWRNCKALLEHQILGARLLQAFDNWIQQPASLGVQAGMHQKPAVRRRR
jgi:hypothetical protein